jgi:hypothetical protein
VCVSGDGQTPFFQKRSKSRRSEYLWNLVEKFSATTSSHHGSGGGGRRQCHPLIIFLTGLRRGCSVRASCYVPKNIMRLYEIQKTLFHSHRREQQAGSIGGYCSPTTAHEVSSSDCHRELYGQDGRSECMRSHPRGLTGFAPTFGRQCLWRQEHRLVATGLRDIWSAPVVQKSPPTHSNSTNSGR